MRFFDFFALTVLAVVPILWSRSRLPLMNRNPPFTPDQGARIGALIAAILCSIYIVRYVIYR